MLKPEILIVEDEDDIRLLIEGVLQDEGYSTRSSANGINGIRLIKERLPSLVILDVWLGDDERDGIEILEDIKKLYPFLPVIMISGHTTIEKAVLSIKKGAYDFIEKPFQVDKMLLVINRALENVRLRSIEDEYNLNDPAQVILHGPSVHAQYLRKAVEDLALTDTRVFFSGPIGSGKDYLASLIHKKSQRRDGRFFRINLSGTSDMELESRVFGLDVSGEETSQIGIFEKAHLSSVFISELMLLPLSVQKKLLDYILAGSFKRMGGKELIHANIRFFSATQYSKNLHNIKPELINLLQIDSIDCMPLSKRQEDIPDMIKFLLKNICYHWCLPDKQIELVALQSLMQYAWPGNIYELKAVLEWTILKHSSVDCLDASHFSDLFKPQVYKNIVWQDLPIKEARENFERAYLEKCLHTNDFNINRMSQAIGMDRTAIYRKLSALGVEIEKK